MSTNRKPHADAKLKTLPEARQSAIIEFMRDHKHPETIAWLKADGISVSGGTLTRFWQWWHLRQRLARNESTVTELLDDLKASNSNLSEEEMFVAGQKFFSALAIAEEDADAWAKAQKAARDKEGLKLERQKFQRETCELFLKWAADSRAKEIAAGTASNADKIAKLGELMFGEDWQ